MWINLRRWKNNDNKSSFNHTNHKSIIVCYFWKSFGFDVRSLALFRFCLGALFVFDMVSRWTNAKAHYSQIGVTTIQDMMAWNPALISLSFMNGSVWFQHILFFISVLFGISFWLGFHTWYSNLGCWIMLTSFHNRNHFLLNGGDQMERVVLFFALFLPLSEVFSVDSALRFVQQQQHSPQCSTVVGKNYKNEYNKRRPFKSFSSLFVQFLGDRKYHWERETTTTCIPQGESTNPIWFRYTSVGCIAFSFQFFCVYWAAFLMKWIPEWLNGTALYWALAIDRYKLPLGQFIYLNSGMYLMGLITHAVHLFQGVLPLLIISPVYNDQLRTLAVVCVCVKHIGFGMSLSIGLFMWIPCVSALAFLPSAFWTFVFKRLSTPSRKLTIKCSKELTLICMSLFSTFTLHPDTQISKIHSYHSINREHIIGAEKEMEEREREEEEGEGEEEEGEVYIQQDDVKASFKSRKVERENGGERETLIVENWKSGERWRGYPAFFHLIQQSLILWPIAAYVLPTINSNDDPIREEKRGIDRIRDADADVDVDVDRFQRSPSSPFSLQFISDFWEGCIFLVGLIRPQILPNYHPHPHPRSHSRSYSCSLILREVVAFICITWVVYYNTCGVLQNSRMPTINGYLSWGNVLLRLDQSWAMFAPPQQNDGWWVMPGILLDPTQPQIDLFKPEMSGVSWEKPSWLPRTTMRWKSQRWRGYFDVFYSHAQMVGTLHQYLCYEWNSRHTRNDTLVNLSFYFIPCVNKENFEESVGDKVLYWQKDCLNQEQLLKRKKFAGWHLEELKDEQKDIRRVPLTKPRKEGEDTTPHT